MPLKTMKNEECCLRCEATCRLEITKTIVDVSDGGANLQLCEECYSALQAFLSGEAIPML